MIPRTEEELRRLIDHLGDPDAMAQWLAGILTEEERKDGKATPVVSRKRFAFPINRHDTGTNNVSRKEGEGNQRLPEGEQGTLFHRETG
tara:strand:+ start:421 stop:687 length:267 start_codon:yes stop_codon:yes gene_type:complete